MRKAVLWSIVLVASLALPARAQTAAQLAKEAEIKADVPFIELLKTVPGLTFDQYTQVVRELAAQELRQRQVFSLPTPAAPMVPYLAPPTLPAAGPPSLVGADGTYLGVVSSNQFDPNSISNPYGQYGSPFSPTSVNNPFGVYGSPFSPLSATNPYTTQAPAIVNPYLGRLSANPYAPDSTSNQFGPYGSPFSPTSVTNPFSPFGSPFSPSSVTNPYAISPMILTPPLPTLPPIRPWP